MELAERIFDHDLSDKAVMIIGAGKMGEACVRHLAKKAARAILVTNRSFDRAVNLANEFGGRAVTSTNFFHDEGSGHRGEFDRLSAYDSKS